MPTLNYGWRDGDGGDPPRVRVRLTPPAVRPSVLSPGKTVSTNTVMQESITGAGSFADFEPGLYNAIVTFGRPGSSYFTGAGDPIEALINMPNADADLGALLEAAGVQPVASEWLSVVSNLLPRAEAEATYAPKGSPFFARRDESVPELFSYFGDDENAYSVVPKFDSGQEATAAGAPWSIAGGTLVPLGSGVRAAYYRSPDMGSVVTRVGGRFRLLPGSGTRTGGGTACIAILNGLIDPASITVDMAAHFWTTSTAWAYTVWQAGVGQTVLASGFYSTPLLTDWSTEYELQVWLNGTTATFDLPDGSRHTIMDSRIGSYAGNFAFWESFLPGGDTDDMTAFTHVWCGTGVQRIPGLLLDRAQADTTYAPRVTDAVLTRDSEGRITSAVENGVAVTYTRDGQGRIASETKNGKTTTYTRDGSGRVSGWSTV